jgi:sec-independent protein translocase protein TatB
MFDVSFSELMLIGVVALVVIGPERLPKVARTAGLLFGRMQRYVATVKADIEREVNMSELKDLQNLKKEVEVLQSEVNAAGQEIAQAATANISMAQKSIAEIQAQAQLGSGSVAATGLAQPTPSVDQADVHSAPVERIAAAEIPADELETARPQMELGLEGGELRNKAA